MKIDIVIGNPPYNEEVEDNSQSPALYDKFINIGINLATEYVSMIIPSRWMTSKPAGVNKKWVEKFRVDKHIKHIEDYKVSTDIFTNKVSISGGVCYFIYDIQNEACSEDEQEIRTHNADGSIDIQKGISALPDAIFRDKYAASIIKHIVSTYNNRQYNRFTEIVKGCTTFYQKGKRDKTGNELMHTNWKGYSASQTEVYNIKYYVSPRNSQLNTGYAWVNLSQIPNGTEWINRNKVYLSITGPIFGEILNKPFYGEPNSCCAMTYRIIESKHDSKEECNNIIKYIETKFFRYLVSLKKQTQSVKIDDFNFVPMQDFMNNTDIDWSQSVKDIDKQLYAKYGLSDDEINHIEETIKSFDKTSTQHSSVEAVQSNKITEQNLTANYVQSILNQ